MSIQIKRMNWVRNRSAWEQQQAWQKRREANRQIYEQNKSAAISAFGNAFTGQINGIGEIAIQMAARRIQAATDAKTKELQKEIAATQQSVNSVA